MTYIIVSLISLAIGFGLGRVKSKATIARAENALDSFGADINADIKKHL